MSTKTEMQAMAEALTSEELLADLLDTERDYGRLSVEAADERANLRVQRRVLKNEALRRMQ